MPDAAFKSTGDIDPSTRVEGLEWLYPDQHIDDVCWPERAGNHPAASAMGGVAIDTYGNVYGVKSPVYRLPADRHLPGKYEQDVPKLDGLERDPSLTSPNAAGVEAELMTYYADGTPFALRKEDGQPITEEIGRLVGDHPELWGHTAEIDTGQPETNSANAIARLRDVIVDLFQALPNGVLIDPVSAWMEESEPNMGHVTPHPYVHVMVEALGDHVMNFLGHGIHEHYDVEPKHILFVAQYLQMLSPYLNAGLQSAPYIHGELDPRLSEIFESHTDIDLLREVEKESNNDGWASVRYATRYFGSSAGGVRPNFHTSLDEFMRTADRQLRDGFVNNIARADGPHGDVRQRFDLKPGRVELCVKDNPAGNMAVLKAYMDLTWSVINSLVKVSQRGDEGVDTLHTAFADLFGDKENPADMTALYERVHRNSLVIAKDGPGPTTTVQDGKGNRVDVAHQVERVINFVNANDEPVSQKSAEIIRSTLGDPRSLRIGSTMNDYYTTNFATPADYIKLAVRGYIESGMSQEAALRRAQLDRMQAFSAYILNAA